MPFSRLDFQNTAYSGVSFIFLIFQAVPLYLPPLLCCFNHIMLSKHIHGGGAAFLEITMGFFVKAEENN